eukprot:Seg381.27 transcript_id=Seg381.27/GoldUCD/mRNA.D3Y31 product="Anti-sigma-I factor RsgI6" protein_id=Seg381.27/GoldUCD/D3Y31
MISILLLLTFTRIIASEGLHGEYEFLGCWKSRRRSAIGNSPKNEDSAFGPIFKKLSSSSNREQACAKAAAKKGLDSFVIAHNECRGDQHTGLRFRRHGKSNKCDHSKMGHSARSGRVYVRGGLYSQHDANDVQMSLISERMSSNEGTKREFHTEQSVKDGGTEIVRKDVILLNKFFKKIYGNVDENSASSESNTAFADNDNFHSYHGDEADTYETIEKQAKRSSKKENLLVNPGFEEPITHGTWNCLGELNHGTGGIMIRTSKYTRTGKFAGVCHSRVGSWAGPGQFVGHVVKPGHAYSVRGFTRLMNASDVDLYHIELWVRYQEKDAKNGTETRIIIAKRDKLNNNKGWQEWNAQFFLPSRKNGFRYVQILFKGPKHHVDIVIDDMVLEELPLEKDWLQEVKARTEKLRKRDVTIRLRFDSNVISPEQLSTIRVKVEQKRHHFGFGSAVNHSPLEDNAEYRDFFMKNFEWGVPESAMKWPIMEEKKGDHKHTDMDNFIKTLHKYNISMRGHCLFWAVESEVPKWLNKLSKKDLLKEMQKRLNDTVCKYKKRIAHWDVNNEMLHGSYFADKLGPKIRDWMYKRVYKRDPNSKLFVNEFDVVANGIYTQAYLEQIEGFKRRRIPVHGIGVQGHFLGWTHPSILQERFDILAKAGIPIWITELDVLEHNETKRADTLEHIMRVAFGHPAVSGIILWAFWSNAAWRGADTALIDDDFSVNKVGQRYLDLRKEWKTKLTLAPSLVLETSCDFKFRAYHGIHDVTVTFPDGQQIINEIKVSPKRQALLVEINTHVDG